MIHIPDLVPFHFVKEEVVDYKTVFPNKDNTQQDRNVAIPEWKQVVPSETAVEFILWMDDTAAPIVTSTLGATITVTSITTASTYYAWRVSVSFTSVGLGSLEITHGGESYKSNSFSVKASLYDETREYAYIQFSHFKNDFDYWFVEGSTTYNYGVWVEANNIEPNIESEVSTYEDDNNDSEVTYSTANDAISLLIPAVERWFERVLNHVSVCSVIYVNGIEYTPLGAAASEQVENEVNRFNVTLTLKENN